MLFKQSLDALSSSKESSRNASNDFIKKTHRRDMLKVFTQQCNALNSFKCNNNFKVIKSLNFDITIYFTTVCIFSMLSDLKWSKYICSKIVGYNLNFYPKNNQHLIQIIIIHILSIFLQELAHRPYFWSQSPIKQLLIDDWIWWGFAEIVYLVNFRRSRTKSNRLLGIVK